MYSRSAIRKVIIIVAKETLAGVAMETNSAIAAAALITSSLSPLSLRNGSHSKGVMLRISRNLLRVSRCHVG